MLPLSLLLLLLLLMQYGDSRTVGNCEKRLSKCRGKSWHYDAVCYYKKKCVTATEREYSFKIVAKMRQMKNRKETGTVVKSLWMRGNGPGLTWDKAIELRRSGSSVDSWKTEIKYRSSSDALLCTAGDYCSANQKAIEFRLYRDQMGKDDMLGPNFYAELPLSGSLQGSNSFLSPSLTVYPWFDGKEVSMRGYEIESSFLVSSREKDFRTTLDVLYPPSFEHNSRKQYPLILYLGFDVQAFIPLLEYAFVQEAHIQEAIVVGVRPPRVGRPFSQFSPYPHSHVWQCKKKGCVFKCMTCWLPTSKESCDKDEIMYQVRKCLKPKLNSSKGEGILDFIEMDIVPKLRDVTQERLLVDFPNHRMTIIGEYGGPSLLACHAALTRPHVYQNAACLSASFYWPLSSSRSNLSPNPGIFQVFRNLKQQLEATPALRLAYLSQKYYIDISHAPKSLVDAYEPTDNFVKQLEETLLLKKGKNILYFTVPTADINYEYMSTTSTLFVYHQILPALKFFLSAEGGPSKEGARLQPLSDKTIAEQNELYGHLVKGSNKSSFPPLESGQYSSCDEHVTPPAGASRPTEVPILFFLPILGSYISLADTCNSDPFFPVHAGMSVLISVVVTVIIMCLREMGRKEAEEAEKEERELMDAIASASDID